ncbi:peptidase M24, structural domain-containing protein [Kickxella alabastrina]|uniref:peptidase M24, structural domain-containing protein n=1 Tax=Kickxella alabastrina TaxID=61397 RepID=UPI00221F0A90|nr:peptidase M24, structural domain-containing protein [Kickxella alabastrina]KAI7834307.1 peptidase M24, structural domain-containing protein [Kickxella alabastrina]
MSAATTATKTPTTIEDNSVLTKYKAAADVTNSAIRKVISACKEGSKIIDLCKLGDAAIEVGLSTQYTKDKKLSKGISYPTSVSVNNIVCHFAPSATDVNADQALKNGDVVRIQLGAHIDGFAAVAGNTVVVGASETSPVTGKTADAIAAAHYAAEAIQRLIKPGNKNMTVTDKVQKVISAFDCKHIENILSYEQCQNDLDGGKHIIFNPAPAQRQSFAVCEFAPYEVYMIDIFVTTGEGRTKKSELRTNIYKKTGSTYQLKMKAARAAFSEISGKPGKFPFALRSCEDERGMRMGLIECIKANVVQAFEVQEEKQGEVVAQVTFTALVTPSGVDRITQGLVFDEKVIKTEKKIEDAEIKELLATSTRIKKKSAKK